MNSDAEAQILLERSELEARRDDASPETVFHLFGLRRGERPRTKSQELALSNLFQALGFVLTYHSFEASLIVGTAVLFVPLPWRIRKHYYSGGGYAILIYFLLGVAQLMQGFAILLEFTKTKEFKHGFEIVAIEFLKGMKEQMERQLDWSTSHLIQSGIQNTSLPHY